MCYSRVDPPCILTTGRKTYLGFSLNCIWLNRGLNTKEWKHYASFIQMAAE